MRTTNFIHFFEIARVAPINRQVCAITGKPRSAAGGCKRQRKSTSTLRLVRALHLICILGLRRCRRQSTRDRNSLTCLGWVPALPGEFATHSTATKGHLWHPAAKASPFPFLLPQCPFSHAQLAVTFPLCFNRLLSVSLNAGKRVFYVPCKRAREWSRGGACQLVAWLLNETFCT